MRMAKMLRRVKPGGAIPSLRGIEPRRCVTEGWRFLDLQLIISPDLVYGLRAFRYPTLCWRGLWIKAEYRIKQVLGASAEGG